MSQFFHKPSSFFLSPAQSALVPGTRRIPTTAPKGSMQTSAVTRVSDRSGRTGSPIAVRLENGSVTRTTLPPPFRESSSLCGIAAFRGIRPDIGLSACATGRLETVAAFSAEPPGLLWKASFAAPERPGKGGSWISSLPPLRLFSDFNGNFAGKLEYSRKPAASKTRAAADNHTNLHTEPSPPEE